MNPKWPNSPIEKNRLTRIAVLSIPLLAVTLAAAGCNGERLRGVNDRPVVISGGSVTIGFDQKQHSPHPQHSEKFKSKKNKIVAVEVSGDAGFFVRYDIPRGGVTTITVKTEDKNNSDISQYIMLRDLFATEEVELRFTPKVFKPDGDKFYNGDYKITELEVENGSVKCLDKEDKVIECPKLPASGRFEIKIGTKP
ncbi:MAG: hypothetical protein ACRD9R_06295 [Pyrinomonadaceae bacterium]